MTVDELLLTQNDDEEALLPAGRHAILPELTRATVRGAISMEVRDIEGAVNTTPTGIEIELGGLLEAPATAGATRWPVVGILQTFPGLHVEVKTVLWSVPRGSGSGC